MWTCDNYISEHGASILVQFLNVRGAYDLESGDLENQYSFVCFFPPENSGGLSYSYLSCRISL